MILIAPPCSATNSRPLPSPACAISTGSVKPLATGRKVTAGGAANAPPQNTKISAIRTRIMAGSPQCTKPPAILARTPDMLKGFTSWLEQTSYAVTAEYVCYLAITVQLPEGTVLRKPSLGLMVVPSMGYR